MNYNISILLLLPISTFESPVYFLIIVNVCIPPFLYSVYTGSSPPLLLEIQKGHTSVSLDIWSLGDDSFAVFIVVAVDDGEDICEITFAVWLVEGAR